jgi:hypothetical protein
MANLSGQVAGRAFSKRKADLLGRSSIHIAGGSDERTETFCFSSGSQRPDASGGVFEKEQEE